MSRRSLENSFYIGWDVGAWHCTGTSKSRDAIVILDSEAQILGEPWRGNLRSLVNGAENSREWVSGLFSLCCGGPPPTNAQVTLAIDTPLGFSSEFLALICGLHSVPEITDYSSNPYLFRRTERLLFQRGFKPLSAINHQIGSQATKGMHVLARFAPVIECCGVWTDSERLHVIETYPTACRDAAVVQHLRAMCPEIEDADIEDALVCALVAKLFATDRDMLQPPEAGIPPNEGWIWAPREV